MSEPTDPRVEAAIDAVIKARGWRDSCWGDGAIGGFDYSNEEKKRHVIRDHEAEAREGKMVILFETEDYEEYQREYRRTCIRREVSAALKAADEAAWRPIEGVKYCPLAAMIEQGSDEGPYIGSCRDAVWCDGLDMVEPTHYMPLPTPPETTS